MIKKAVLLLLLPVLSLLPLLAQTSPSATEALSLYKTGKYAEAARMYRHLLERNNRDAQLNYYYALSLIQLKERPDEALQRMKLAAVRAPEPEVHYHLGYLYQRVYEVEMARTHYQRYLDLSKTGAPFRDRSEEHTSELQSRPHLVCRLLLEKKNYSDNGIEVCTGTNTWRSRVLRVAAPASGKPAIHTPPTAAETLSPNAGAQGLGAYPVGPR